MQPLNVRELVFHTGAATVVGGAFAVLLGVQDDVPVAAAAIPLALGVLYVVFMMRRYIRRARAGTEPPAAITKVLEDKVHFYRELPEGPERARFRRDVHYFLLDHNIVGVKVEVGDELRALVAASAAVLSFGHPNYEWDTTRDILIYPSAYTEDYDHNTKTGTRLGQVGSQGPIILSAAALRAGFARGTDGHNVGFHEFAHVLDFDDGEADGIPANLNWHVIRPWVDRMHAHFQRRDRKGRRSQVLRNYGYTNEAEFFACATEMFFEQPSRLKRRAPDLYDLLADFYGQDLVGESA